MLTREGRFWRRDGKAYVYVPADVVHDSAFPFKNKNGKVTVTIVGKTLVISEKENK